ncbi:prolipoprotein diacylglyceryl transferase [Mycobacterium sp.]|uniref:prolipoprotein diacylglyceryl transferase n=1 Tax=Mycobacterium sp. TaxID=1785 RepID=UPI003A848E49
MTTTLLAYIPSPSQGVWHLGPVPIRAYAFFIITGIVLALLIGDRRWIKRGGQRGIIYDIALWTVPFGLIGGRLYHLATDWRTYWGPDGAGLNGALRIWDGGLGIWGAVALGVVGAWIGCRLNGIPLPAFLDALAPGVVLAQAIGRLGNYFNQELYGRETTAPWGLEIFYRRDPSGFVHVHSLDGVSTGQVAFVVQPTFLYELLWNLLVFAVLLFLDRRFIIGHGRLFASYVALYCMGRFVIELLRDDAATHIAGIRINTFTSTFVFVGAVVYLVLAPKGREDPQTLRGWVEDEPEVPEDEEPEGAAELDRPDEFDESEDAQEVLDTEFEEAAQTGDDDETDDRGETDDDETAEVDQTDDDKTDDTDEPDEEPDGEPDDDETDDTDATDETNDHDDEPDDDEPDDDDTTELDDTAELDETDGDGPEGTDEPDNVGEPDQPEYADQPEDTGEPEDPTDPPPRTWRSRFRRRS